MKNDKKVISRRETWLRSPEGKRLGSTSLWKVKGQTGFIFQGEPLKRGARHFPSSWAFPDSRTFFFFQASSSNECCVSHLQADGTSPGDAALRRRRDDDAVRLHEAAAVLAGRPHGGKANPAAVWVSSAGCMGGNKLLWVWVLHRELVLLRAVWWTRPYASWPVGLAGSFQPFLWGWEPLVTKSTHNEITRFIINWLVPELSITRSWISI